MDTVTGVTRVPGELLVHLRRARDFADRDYAEPLDLEALADAAGVSKYHFLRAFAATYGTTPMAYLAERRIERAQDLLRATNLTVTEVCMAVGHTSLGSFSAKFRQLVGVPPSEYQARYAGAGIPHVPGCWVFMLRTERAPATRSLRRDAMGARGAQPPSYGLRERKSATSEKHTDPQSGLMAP